MNLIPSVRRPAARALRAGLCLVALVLSAAGHAQNAEPLELAKTLLGEVQPEDSSYDHGEGTVRWQGESGSQRAQSHTDCSGLINALLQRSYGIDGLEFQRWLGRRRPLAVTYYDAIVKGRGFGQIRRATDIRPGDLVAIRYPDGSANSGHIMLVAAAPQLRPASKPTVNRTEQWALRVIDSSQSGHGPSDTRFLRKSQFRQGLGEGVLRLYAQPGGAIAGYSWSLYANSEYYGQDDRQLVVGRLVRPGTSCAAGRC